MTAAEATVLALEGAGDFAGLTAETLDALTTGLASGFSVALMGVGAALLPGFLAATGLTLEGLTALAVTLTTALDFTGAAALAGAFTAALTGLTGFAGTLTALTALAALTTGLTAVFVAAFTGGLLAAFTTAFFTALATGLTLAAA